MNSGKPDIVCGLVFLAVATVTLVMTAQLEDHQQAQLSIRQFPGIIGSVMVVLSVLLIGQGIKKARKDRPPEERSEPKQPRPGLRELLLQPFVLRFVGVGLVGFVYTRVITDVGYLVATPGLLILTMLLYGEKKWHRLVFIPLIVSFVLYHVFRTFFRVPLPTVGL